MLTLSKEKNIDFISEVPGITPVLRNYLDKWKIKAFYYKRAADANYLSPNRRDFYKVFLLLKATGVFTIGTRSYYVQEPTIMFIPPADIISWKGIEQERETFYCLLKKSFIEEQPMLKSIIDKYHFFADQDRHVITLDKENTAAVKALFEKLIEEGVPADPIAEDTMQAYLQLIILACAKVKNYAPGLPVNDSFNHIHEFFAILEKEITDIRKTQPIRIKTASEFADALSITPNYLNNLLKKYTGQNVSAHIKNRLLDESKMLLLYTDWTLQDIGYALGFADQPNFSIFFKKLAGITPAGFRNNKEQ